MDHIVHLGRGRTVLAPQRSFVDPTVSRPRNSITQESRAVLRRILPPKRTYLPISTENLRFEPGNILTLRADQCRYPLTDHLFCGKRSVPGKSWCPQHDDVVHGRDFPVERLCTAQASGFQSDPALGID